MSNRLFHGTSLKHLPSILEEGLLPRAGSGHEGYWDVESASDRVYLTRAYAPYYAFCAANTDETLPVILEVDIDQISTSLLIPDEDFLEQQVRRQYEQGADTLWKELGGNMNDVTEYFREHAPNMSHWAEPSLDNLGTCAYLGEIPLDAIKRILVVKSGTRSLLAVSDPTITLLNYTLMGAYYRNLSGMMVDGPEYPMEEDMLASSDSLPELYQRLDIAVYTPDQFSDIPCEYRLSA